MFSLYTCIKEFITTNIAFNFSLVVGCRDVVDVVEAPELTHQAFWHLVARWGHDAHFPEYVTVHHLDGVTLIR